MLQYTSWYFWTGIYLLPRCDIRERLPPDVDVSSLLERCEHVATMEVRLSPCLPVLHFVTPLFSCRGAHQCLSATGNNRLLVWNPSTSYKHHFLQTQRYKTRLLSCCFKASNLQALPISIILMTSSEQLTCFSCRPTTWTCCLPSSRTRSFAFLFKRSNTYIQAIRLRQIWTKTPCR